MFRGSIPTLIAKQASLDVVNLNLRDRIEHKPELLAQMRAALPGVR